MKKFFLAILLTSLVTIIVVFIVTRIARKTTHTPPGENNQPTVAATFSPLYDIVKNVTCAEDICQRSDESAWFNSEILVQQLVPTGMDPHSFELRPSDLIALKNTKIIFYFGHGIDDWSLEVTDVWPEITLCRVDTNIELINDTEEESGYNPHYWLSVENAKKITENVRYCLLQVFPEKQQPIDANIFHYKESVLDELKRKIEQKLEILPNRNIITFHNAWPYFAKEFGLEIVGTFEPFPGKESTPRYLIDLQNTIKEYDIKVIFSEPQQSDENLRQLARDLGLKLAVLVPEGARDIPHSRNQIQNIQDLSYENMMLYNATTIQKTLCADYLSEDREEEIKCLWQQ